MDRRISYSSMILLIAGFLFMFLLILTENASAKIITVDDDGGADFQRIQDAVDAAGEGDTIRVYAGNYNKGAFIDKRIRLEGNGSDSTVITLQNEDGVIINASGVTITEICIEHHYYIQKYSGIWMNANETSIINVTCANWFYGIYGNNSCSSTISYNHFQDNYYGVYLQAMMRHTSGNTITNNICNDRGYGIYIYAHWARSRNNSILYNKCIGGTCGISLFGYCTETVIAGNRCQENGYGIELGPSGPSSDDRPFDTIVEDNILLSNRNCGIHLSQVVRTTMENNILIDNKNAITIDGYSAENTAQNNLFSDNSEYGVDASNLNIGFINITENWWGDDSGPYHPDSNSNGLGDAVSDHTEFRPWRSLPPDYHVPYVDLMALEPHRSFVGDDVSFLGSALSYDQIISYVWTSSMDGELYNGSESQFITSELSNATHTISLKVLDGHGFWSEEFHSNLTIELDTDDDGIPDFTDVFPEDGNEWNDTDEDGVGDNSDAFPTDPAASVDMDNDGHPDEWHTGNSETTSTTGLKLDHYPDDPARWKEEKDKDDDNGFIVGFELMVLIGSLFVSLVVKRMKK